MTFDTYRLILSDFGSKKKFQVVQIQNNSKHIATHFSDICTVFAGADPAILKGRGGVNYRSFNYYSLTKKGGSGPLDPPWIYPCFCL